MTIGLERFPVRVMVPDVWDHVVLAVDAGSTVADLKRQALERARVRRDPREYTVKYRGAEVVDETTMLHALGGGVPPNAAFIVLPRRRHPVR